jgi:hypothetical protein
LANSKKSLEENQSALKANRAEMKQLYALEEQINDAQFKRIELLEKENALLQKNISSQKRNKKAIEDSAKSIRGNNKFLEDTEDILGSIADKVGKSNKLYKEGEKYLEKQKSGLSSIADLTESIADPKLSKAAESATNAYKKFQQSVARVGDRAAMTGKQQEEANVAIARARLEYDESVVSLGKMGENGQMILSTLNGMADETQQFGKSVTATTKEWEKMDAILGSFSGIPAMSEFNTLLKTNIRDTIAWKAAVFALGAALGKVAYDYFGAPIKAGMQADRERQQNQIDGIAEVAKLQTDGQSIPKQIEQERLEARISAEGEIQKLQQEAAFAGAKAAIQFSAQMQSGAAQFERAAKTALFGNKIGSVGYGAAQLQLAGISADKIASGMEAASAATGRMPSARVGADMSIMAERTGTSVDNIASINEMFQRMDGASESTAMNLSEGLRNMADQANIGLGGLMREIAEASKDALSYQIKSGPALAKQVAYAQSLGVSFGDIAKAGKSMVMNYKDSIKNEMQLSAMLGKNVDLSEVRAKFASGDTEGAMKSLQAQGLDPAQMDMFAQEQLSQALGGMDLNSLQKIATKKGADVGGLKEGSAKAGNQDFLSRTQSAESALNSKQASISAQTAILDAKLSQKIADSYLESPEYASLKTKQNEAAQEAAKLATAMTDAWKSTDAYKKSLSDSMKLDFISGLKENLMSGLAAVAGGIGTSLLDKMIPSGGMGGKVKGMFGIGAGAAADGGGGAEASGGAGGGSATEGPIASVAAQIEAAEPVLSKAKTLGENLKDFGEGVGGFIKSVGSGMGGAIQALLTGFGEGMAVIGKNGLYVAAGGVAIAAVIVAIGAGIAGASWIMGKALPTLAEGLMAFDNVDGANLKSVGLGVAALGVGLAAMGAGAVIGGIGNLVGSLFGGGIEDTIKKVETFAQANINADKVKNNADAIVAYSKAMAASGLGNAASGLGNMVGGIANGITKFFGGDTELPLDKMAKFGAAEIANADTIKKNAETFTAFATAMDSYKGSGGSVGGILAEGLGKFFELKPPIEQMKEFGKELFVKDTAVLKANAEAFTTFGNAMATYKGSGAGTMDALAQGVSSFLNVPTPLDKFKEFAAIPNIDVQKTKNNAEAFTAFGNAMASYSGTGTGFWSSLGKGISDFFGGGDGDLIAKFREFAALNAGGVIAISDAIGKFNANLSNFKLESAEAVGKGMTSVANATSTYLTSDRTDSINAFASAIGTLNTQLTELSGIASLVDTAAFAFSNLASALNTLGSINTAALNQIPWGDMEDFASEGGKFVLASSGGGSFALAKDTTDNIKKMATNTEAMVKLNNTLVKLTKEGFFGGETSSMKLYIDGKDVNHSLTRYKDKTKKVGPTDT